jgi:1-deoxy-D-xylulose-5-phosphate reductoisomerase
MNKPLNIIILGSTGSVGTQTLKVAAKHEKQIHVIGLACHSNEILLKKQAKKFKVPASKTVLTSKTPKRLIQLIKTKKADLVVNAISGEAGLKPTIEILKAGKILALANKESVILDGKRLNKLARTNNTQILPLDSEHHAVYRLLKTRSLTKYNPRKVEKITLTCSGGPFFGYTSAQLKKVTPKQALNNPNWSMGPKILIESATLLNKGFELIEAHYLFECPLARLDAVIDRKSYIHAIVKFRAHGKEKAQTLALAYKPDMKTVIEDTLLGYPAKNRKLKFLINEKLKKYPFKKISHKTFPSINNVLKAHKKGQIKAFYKKTEKKIEKFLKGNDSFTDLLS